MKLADVPYRKCLSVIEKENLVRDILEQQVHNTGPGNICQIRQLKY